MSQAHGHLGNVVRAEVVRTNTLPPAHIRSIVLLLAASVALMMTGFGIILPIFPRRLAEFGAGVEALGVMTMAFALTQMIFAPVGGTLADRWGRKPMILIALAAFALANLGYLLADSALSFILVRAVAGAFTAGLFPAAMGIVADITPEEDRARWIGIVMGGYGAGLVFGPVVGGVLYDIYGFAMPFIASAGMAVIGLIAAALQVPETRTPTVRHRETLNLARERAWATASTHAVWDVLPRPLDLFAALLLVDFIGNFAFAYIEPQMVFYIYDTLAWSTADFGLLVGGYGLAMMVGQIFLGQASDRYGRKPVIVLGIILNGLLYPGMAYLQHFWAMFIMAVLAGFGMALISPALSALFLDITLPQYRSRVLGIKGSVLSLGGVLGPLLVAVAASVLSPQQIFLSAALLMVISAVVAVALIREPDRLPAHTPDLASQVMQRRSIAAQSSLRGVVLEASRQRQIA